MGRATNVGAVTVTVAVTVVDDGADGAEVDVLATVVGVALDDAITTGGVGAFGRAAHQPAAPARIASVPSPTAIGSQGAPEPELRGDTISTAETRGSSDGGAGVADTGGADRGGPHEAGGADTGGSAWVVVGITPSPRQARSSSTNAVALGHR